MDERMPMLILTATIVLIILSLAIFIVGTITDTANIEAEGVESVLITDPSSDVTIDIDHTGSTITLVQYHDNDGWHNVDTGNYTYAGDTVTIDHEVWS